MEGGSRTSSESSLQADHILEMLTHNVRPGRPPEGLLVHSCFSLFCFYHSFCFVYFVFLFLSFLLS